MPRSAHPATVPCQLVRTQDGWLFVMCMTDKFWRALAEGVGHADWVADPRFDTAAHRRENRQVLSDLLDGVFSTRSTASWLDELTGKLPLSPVHDLGQALRNPFVESIGMIQRVDRPAATDLRLVASPIKLDGRRLPARAGRPLGADTDDQLTQAGYSAQDVAGLRARGVI